MTQPTNIDDVTKAIRTLTELSTFDEFPPSRYQYPDGNLREEDVREDVALALDVLTDLIAVSKMNINEIAKRHYAWVDQVGWHNKTPLECLALVASEVGEAANECRGLEPTSDFGSELADIILRVADLAVETGVDLASEIGRKMELCQVRGTRGRLK